MPQNVETSYDYISGPFAIFTFSPFGLAPGVVSFCGGLGSARIGALPQWRLTPRYAIAVLCLALVLFVLLAVAVRHGVALRFDMPARGAIHVLASVPLTRAMHAVTQLGSELVLIPIILLMMWRLTLAGRRRDAGMLLLATAGAEALVQILKLAFQRPRPDAFFGFPQPENYSFPSGHSMVSAVFYVALATILTSREPSRLRRIAIWASALLVTFLVGFSRVYLGVHYPSDVLAGYAGAAAWLSAVWAGQRIWQSRQPPNEAGRRGASPG
jgi:undecaprenyl-diphosphatase